MIGSGIDAALSANWRSTSARRTARTSAGSGRAAPAASGRRSRRWCRAESGARTPATRRLATAWSTASCRITARPPVGAGSTASPARSRRRSRTGPSRSPRRSPGSRLLLKNAWLNTQIPSVCELKAGPPSVRTKISSKPVMVPMIASRTLMVMLGRQQRDRQVAEGAPGGRCRRSCRPRRSRTGSPACRPGRPSC